MKTLISLLNESLNRNNEATKTLKLIKQGKLKPKK